MNAMEKDNLLTEAKLQITALNRINQWKKLAIMISAIGVAIAYAGAAGSSSCFFLCIPGIFLIITGAAAAFIMDMGLKNGRRNVEKIIHAISDGREL